MKKSILSILASLAFLHGCGSAQDSNYVYRSFERQKRIEAGILRQEEEGIEKDDLDAGPVRYCIFFDIDFSSIPAEKIEFPHYLSGLEKRLEMTKPILEDEKGMEDLVLEEALKLGYDHRHISQLSTRDAIMLCANIVAGRMEWFGVDGDKEFINKYGTGLPMDRYFALGFGDCDKYSGIFTATFNILKRHNPNLKNVYVSDESFGGYFGAFKTMPHTWNSLVFLTREGTILTNIDVQGFDETGNLGATREDHLPQNNYDMLLDFYYEVGDVERIYTVYRDFLERTTLPSKKVMALNRMGYLAYRCESSDQDKIEETRRLALESGFGLSDKLLYYSCQIDLRNGNIERAERFRKELFERFPDSFHADLLKNIELQQAE